MDRKKILRNKKEEKLFDELNNLHRILFSEFKQQFSRALPFTDEIFDRWERANLLGFGEGSSIYDSSYVFGDVKIGKNTWLGQFTIIDGSGGLSIGDNCTISSGVHIYTHDNIKQTLSGGKFPIEREKVSIGNCTYIGPQSIISKGITIGNHCVVASNSFVNKNVEDYTIVAGNPAKKIGRVAITENDIQFIYDIHDSNN
ncbi:MAG: acyltransferase [Bacteroidia bacterium]|nr:acyltransferase [Bacteroidia bacterium]